MRGVSHSGDKNFLLFWIYMYPGYGNGAPDRLPAGCNMMQHSLSKAET